MSAAQLQMGASVPFKRLASPSLGKMLQPESSTTANLQVPYLKAGHVQWHGVELPEDLPMMWASAADVKELTPKPGDLLICEGGEVGRAALAPLVLPENTIIQNSLHLVRETNQACPRYLKYALEHVASTGWLDLVCNKATIAHLTVDKLRELPIPYWDKNEQGRIANFLDEQTARIDALIAEKERLASSVRAYEQAEISRLLTHGAHDAPLKKTGKPFIPEAPAGWRVTAFKRALISMGQGWSPQCESQPAQPGEWGVLKVGCVNGTKFDANENKALPPELKPDLTCVLRKGDVLMSRANTKELVGLAAIVEDHHPHLLLCDKLYRLELKQDWVLPEYAVLALRSDCSRRQIELGASGASSSMQNISQDVVRELLAAFPPLDEQRAIVDRAGQIREACGALAGHVNEHIDRLREYRSSLISAAVTGQLELSTFNAAA